jgi:polyphosphate kinase
VRRDPDGKIRRYNHLGTGNCNPSTARWYTDFSLFTSDGRISAAAHDVFNFLTANAEKNHYRPLPVAPMDIAKTVISLIEREMRHARRGKPARIIAKYNAVEIDLMVRGPCTLVPGLRGISSRIRVRSIAGRFLEHSRIYSFENGGNRQVYLGSADWRPRNRYERVELLFPVNDPALRERLRNEVAYLEDTMKARILEADGLYTRLCNGLPGRRKGFSVLEQMIKLAHGHVNGSGRSSGRPAAFAYTPSRAGKASELTETLELEVQDSANATV